MFLNIKHGIDRTVTVWIMMLYTEKDIKNGGEIYGKLKCI